MGTPIAPKVIFRDPLVVVHGQRKVIRMFRRLNRLFPASSIVSFEPIDGGRFEYELIVHYRRKPNQKERPFRTRLQFDHMDDHITAITEHWLSPVKLSAKTGSGVQEFVRKGLGRLLS